MSPHEYLLPCTVPHGLGTMHETIYLVLGLTNVTLPTLHKSQQEAKVAWQLRSRKSPETSVSFSLKAYQGISRLDHLLPFFFFSLSAAHLSLGE